MTTVAERVARGVALLDEVMPGWADRIDLLRLDIDVPAHCVIGQLHPQDGEYSAPYSVGLDRLGWADADDRWERAKAHGFDDAYSARGSRALTDEWRNVIATRVYGSWAAYVRSLDD